MTVGRWLILFVVLLGGGIAVGTWLVSRQDERIEANNDELRLNPPNMDCNPKNLAARSNLGVPLQLAVNRTRVKSWVHQEDESPHVVTVDDEVDNATPCTRGVLEDLARDPNVQRLLKRCGIATVRCEKGGVQISTGL